MTRKILEIELVNHGIYVGGREILIKRVRNP